MARLVSGMTIDMVAGVEVDTRRVCDGCLTFWVFDQFFVFFVRLCVTSPEMFRTTTMVSGSHYFVLFLLHLLPGRVISKFVRVGEVILSRCPKTALAYAYLWCFDVLTVQVFCI